MDISTKYNYYDILEVNQHSPQQDITSAYEKAKATYSGENPAIYTMFSQDEARAMLTMVEEAYSVLGNKTLRSIYDEKIGKGKSTSDLSYEQLQVESKIAFHKLPNKSEAKTNSYNMDAQFESNYLGWTDWDGAKLKQIREYKNISVDRMSEITKISSFYVSAVEKMEAHNLPAVVFVRGYVSQIAKTLNLPEKLVCDSYMAKYKTLLG